MSKNQSGDQQLLSRLKSFDNKNGSVKKRIIEALNILADTGIPFEGVSDRSLEKMAMAFLAVADVNVSNEWKDAKSVDDNYKLGSRDIIRYINAHFEENISSGSYDDIRRKDLKLLTTAEYIIKAAGNTGAATNDPSRKYALSKAFQKLVSTYGSVKYKKELTAFMAGRETLADKLKQERNLKRVAVILPDGKQIDLSSGIHNDLQKTIIEDFLPIFAPGCEVLYIGDTSNKMLLYDKKTLDNLNFFELSHDDLPDVVAYIRKKNWLFLIEAVHSSGPMSELRLLELKKLTKACTAEIIYVTAFLNRAIFKKWAGQIAWETEVWLADNPEHLIHFNGDKFLGPHVGIGKK